jgi:hypothetical protein
MTVGADQLNEWVGSFAERAKDYAHKPENFIRPQDSLDSHREHLRYALRLDGWPSKIVFWYTVDARPDSTLWRHLSIQMSIQTLDPDECIDQGQLNEHKRQILEQFTPVVKLFFPLHEQFHVVARAHEVRPILNPATRQMSYRTPLSFDFLVRHDTTEGMIGCKTIQGLGGRAVLLDQHGRELPKVQDEASANVADKLAAKTVTLAESPESPYSRPVRPRGQVIPLDEKRRRRAREKEARRARKRNRR